MAAVLGLGAWSALCGIGGAVVAVQLPVVQENLRGADGSRGIQGQAGPAGPAGSVGPAGPAGTAGKDGTSTSAVDLPRLLSGIAVVSNGECPLGSSVTGRVVTQVDLMRDPIAATTAPPSRLVVTSAKLCAF